MRIQTLSREPLFRRAPPQTGEEASRDYCGLVIEPRGAGILAREMLARAWAHLIPYLLAGACRQTRVSAPGAISYFPGLELGPKIFLFEKRGHIFRCYNRCRSSRFPIVLGTLESCLESRVLRSGSHRRQSSSSRPCRRERSAGLACRVW
jgi:hypothetical protein